MKRRELLTGLAAALGAGGCASQAPAWVRSSQARYSRQMALPPPATAGAISLEMAIERRRSQRDFGPALLPIATIGQLLWAGQGITSPDGKRAAPSAGALYPLELSVVTPTDVMHYLPQGHRVEVRAVPDLRPELKAAAFGQPMSVLPRPSSWWPPPRAAPAASTAPGPRVSSNSRPATPPRTSCSKRPLSASPSCRSAASARPGRQPPSPCLPARRSCISSRSGQPGDGLSRTDHAAGSCSGARRTAIAPPPHAAAAVPRRRWARRSRGSRPLTPRPGPVRLRPSPQHRCDW